MSNTNINIRLKDSYKLYIPFKDKILFESILEENGISYYTNIDEQPDIDGGLRYFLLSSDKVEIEKLIAANQIISSNESNIMLDFKDYRKLFKVFIIALISLAIIASLILTVNMLKD